MKKNNTSWEKFYLGLGTMAILSGVYFLLKGEYVEGISGSAVGVFLIFQNVKHIKDKKSAK
ncbi:MAG: hypothetical protein ACJAZ3_000833 [Sphingobacteriales bacterium]|jgi:hypothetical protein